VAQLFEPPAPIIGSPSCSIGPPDGDPAVLYISRFQAKLVAERTREGGESDRHIDADHTNAVATTTHPAPLPRNQKKKKALSSRREKTFRPLSNDGFLERGDGGGRRVPLGPDVGAVRQPELDLKLLLHAAGHLRAPPTPANFWAESEESGGDGEGGGSNLDEKGWIKKPGRVGRRKDHRSGGAWGK
jgi:hypothetical protein